MRKMIYLAAVAAISFGISACGGSKANSSAEDYTDTSAEVEVESNVAGGDSIVEVATQGAQGTAESAGEISDKLVMNGKPTIIDFNATWCGPCRQMAPIFHKLAKEFGKDFNFVSIDVDKNPELAQKYNVQSIPAFVFLNDEGKEANRIVGAVPENELREELVHPTWK